VIIVQQLLLAGGYLSVFLVPALLIAGLEIGHPILAFGVVMLAFPLARILFGDYPAATVLWREWIATCLDRLPVAYGVFLLGTVIVALHWLAAGGADSASTAIAFGLSLWMTMLFATCPAHELLHRRSRLDARVGRWIAGIAGYPILGHEHLTHHMRSGNIEAAEWPRVDESVWQFSSRRALAAWRSAVERDRVLNARRRVGPLRGELAEACLVTLGSWTAFTIAGGWAGFAIYGGVMVGVTFGVQIITYLQHWGLGTDNVAKARETPYAWEDTCRFQAWVTLHLSFHQAHHRSSALPYYRLRTAAGAPRPPAGYVVLMVLCLFPRLWRQLMLPALAYWKRQPSTALVQGRRLTCFNFYDRRFESR
jgi:fatty acid desaturase